MSATVSRVADRWFVSLTVETQDDPRLPKAENQGAVGVDLGVKVLATLSTGEMIPGPKAHKALLSRLQRLSRSLSRKKKGSCNRKKAKAKLARLHARISAIRGDALHKLTTNLTSRFHTIGIEDLNVRGMVRNRRLSRAVADMGFFEFRRQLEYKAEMRGSQVVVADRWYASSKTCSCCSYKVSVRQSHLEPERDTKDARVRVTSLRTHEHFGNRVAKQADTAAACAGVQGKSGAGMPSAWRVDCGRRAGQRPEREHGSQVGD